MIINILFNISLIYSGAFQRHSQATQTTDLQVHTLILLKKSSNKNY